MALTLYDVLEVAPDADAPALKRAYRRQAQRWHPDRHGGTPAAHERFLVIRAAYDELRDPGRRRAYDESRIQPVASFEAAPARPAVDERRGDDMWVTASVPPEVLWAGGVAEAAGAVGVACPMCAGQGCARCGGVGQTLRVRRWRIQVPPGHRPGRWLRLAQAGHTGPFFQQPGDVYIRAVPHSKWGWRWSDARERLERTIRVPWGVAKAGGDIRMQGPAGQSLVVRLPPGAGAGGWMGLLGLGHGPPHGREPVWLRVRVGLWFSWGTRRAPAPE